MKKIDGSENLKRQWSFPWPIMDVLIGGRSSIDLEFLCLKDEQDANEFLRSYGYNPAHPADLQRINEIFIEAVHFIESQLIPDEWAKGLRPDNEFLNLENPALLLLWAAKKKEYVPDHIDPVSLQAWSCAVLRIMHTISHLDDLQRLNNIHEAKHQIMERFRRALFRAQNGTLMFGDMKDHIELEKVEWKARKTRKSMLLKLLHKPANVAETIYDIVGVRIVTKTMSESMIAVKYLRQFYLVDFANTHPGRARNNLIDVSQFRTHIETLLNALKLGNISESRFIEKVSELKTPAKKRLSTNPHSSQEYRSIQLTCRQRVRYPDPSFSWLNKLETWLESSDKSYHSRSMIENFAELVSGWSAVRPDIREISIFFPFEVQILDRQAAAAGNKGRASHLRYKKAQVRSARKRILGRVLALR